MAPRNKVFGLGFQKTGTTSLTVIFEKLNYRVGGYQQFRDFADQDGVTMADLEERAVSLIDRYDAFQDTPWPLLYQKLDAIAAGAKFIHVVRNPDAWITSAVNDFGDHPNAIHNAIYGSPYPLNNEAAWLDRYNKHNAEVAEYFKDRPDDYLQLSLEDGVTYEAVCGFLDEPLVGKGAPTANTRFRKFFKRYWWRLTG